MFKLNNLTRSLNLFSCCLKHNNSFKRAVSESLRSASESLGNATETLRNQNQAEKKLKKNLNVPKVFDRAVR